MRSKSKPSAPTPKTPEKHVREAFGVNILSSQHKAIRQIKNNEESPSIHGNKFWGSSYLLMDFLQHNPPEHGVKILELGCGWGLAGIHCAKHYKADVTGVDADRAVFPYLQAHADINNVSITPWQQYFENITTGQLAEFDMIIGADICFWDELADKVFQLINRACQAGVSRIVLTDPERPPFFDLANRCIEDHFAELYEWEVESPRRATGCLLLIENA